MSAKGKLWLGGLALTACLVGCSSTSTGSLPDSELKRVEAVEAAWYWDFGSVEQMAATVDHVVVAKVKAVTYQDAGGGIEDRILDLDVKETLRGKPLPATTLRDLAQRRGDKLLMSEQIALLNAGDEAIFFLVDIPPTYNAVGIPDDSGIIPIVNGQVKIASEHKDAVDAQIEGLKLDGVKETVKGVDELVASKRVSPLPKIGDEVLKIQAGLDQPKELKSVSAKSDGTQFRLKAAKSKKDDSFCYSLSADPAAKPDSCVPAAALTQLSASTPLWAFVATKQTRFVVGITPASVTSVVVSSPDSKVTVPTESTGLGAKQDVRFFVVEVVLDGTIAVTAS